MYDGDMTNSAALPGTVQWYADMHSSACLLVHSILDGMKSLELGSDDYDLMYSALTAANESARSLYDMFNIAAKREMGHRTSDGTSQGQDQHDYPETI